MKNCVFVIEILGERERHLLSLLKSDGFIVTGFGQESFFKDLEKIYLFPISCALSLEKAQGLEENSVVFSRNVEPAAQELLKQKNIARLDYMDDEEFVFKNAYLTAESALYYILGGTKCALSDLSVLICGGGRIAKSLLIILKKLGCRVDIASDNVDELAFSACFADKVFGLKNIIDNVSKYDTIINTVPKIILKGDLLRLIKSGCFILDLASKPGGVDFAKAKELEIDCLHALGVPGKISPQTAAKNLKDSILKRLIVYNNEQ